MADNDLDADLSGKPTDKHPLARETLHNFLKLYHHFRTTNRQISEHGIQPRAFSVLRFIYERGAVTVGDVQEYIYRSPSTASTMLAKLEEQGYVTRTRSQEDNRVVIVELTEHSAVETQAGDVAEGEAPTHQ